MNPRLLAVPADLCQGHGHAAAFGAALLVLVKDGGLVGLSLGIDELPGKTVLVGTGLNEKTG